MKLSLFTTKEQQVEYLNRLADSIEANGLRQAREELSKAEQGVGKAGFLKMNNIPEEKYEEVWAHHIEWLRDNVKYLERKVRKYRKMAKEA